MKDLTAAALAYGARGFAIFPLQPRSKDPLPGSGGFKDATTKTSVIDEWWRRTPHANIGCHPGASRYLVIDIDGAEGEAAAQQLGLLAEPTLEVETGRPDGGRHRWYKHPGG